MKTSKILYAATIALVASLASCDDFLDVDNNSGIPSDEFVTSAENAQTVVNGAYSGLYGLELWRGEIYYYMDFATGELEYRHTDGNIIPLTNFGYTPDQAWVKNYWRCLYRLIGRSNDACSKIWQLRKDEGAMAQMTASDREKIDRLIGECNFLRGLGYLYLVRSFGDRLPSDAKYNPSAPGICIVDTLLTDKDQLRIGRSTLEESWKEVRRNFTTAYKLLPAQWESAKLGAATKGAAAAYLGLIDLYFGMQDPEALQKAKTWFETSMREGGYQLVTDFAHNFDYEHENNIESIFEVQAETANDDEIGNYMWRRLGPEPIWWGTVNVSMNYVNKFIGGYCLTQDLYDRITANPADFISQKDPQQALKAILTNGLNTIIDVNAKTPEEFFALYTGNWNDLGQAVNAAVKAVNPRTRFNIFTDDTAWGKPDSRYIRVIRNAAALETDPRMYPSFYIPNQDVLYQRWDKTDEPITYATQYYGFKKYIPNNAIESWSGEGLPGFAGNSPINQRIYRAAEMFLQYAEACYRLGQTDVALEYLNKVRRRAWGEDINSTAPQPHDYSATTDGNFMDALVAEREKEMCLEGTLWFDYLRMGIAKDLFAARGFNPDKHSRLPIPLSERQIVGMDILTQNSGY